MKKLLLFAILCAAFVTGSAQSKFAKTSTSRVYSDTSANADQLWLYTSLIGNNKATGIKYESTKLSGFVKGSVALEFAIDTTGFYAGTATWVTLADSLTLSNGVTTNRKVWAVLPFIKYARIRVTTIDSTQSLKSTGVYIVR